MAALRAAGTDIPKLAKNGVEIFFTQVFRHNFFHADMHPGNIFVLIDDPANPRYAAIDFGIVGTLDPRDQHYLAENFLAVFDRDYRRVAVLHVESGWVPPNTRVDEMESAIRTVCEPIFDKPIKDISFGTLLLRLFEISRRFNMEVQPQLILLQKTLLQHRRARTRSVSRPRYLEHREPDPARLDARARWRALRDPQPAQAVARHRGCRSRAARTCSRTPFSVRRTARCAFRWKRRRSKDLKAALARVQQAARCGDGRRGHSALRIVLAHGRSRSRMAGLGVVRDRCRLAPDRVAALAHAGP